MVTPMEEEIAVTVIIFIVIIQRELSGICLMATRQLPLAVIISIWDNIR